MPTSRYTVILFYKFTNLKNPERLAKLHLNKCKELNLLGRMILAEEGVNATFEGTDKNINAYKRFLKKDKRFANMKIKESAGTGKAFTKLSIKVRDEVVTLGAGKFNIKKETAKEITATELERMYKRDEDFVILDLRNDYEIASGKFERTIDPKLSNFRDLPEKVKKIKDLKDKRVVAVCTGGIRCEKATCLLKKEGFTNLYQLKDGIHTYMEKYPGKNFKGTLFVFDNRMTTDVVPTKKKEIIGKCEFCNISTENYCSDDSMRPSRKILCCQNCFKKERSHLRESVSV
ncbi:MAG: rhodanese-related sulfurtransferase [Patescibacteria group bacterium]